MEKFSQYRDRGMYIWIHFIYWLAKLGVFRILSLTELTHLIGSGIAPFFPITTQPSGLYLPVHLFLFCFRLPVLLTAALAYLCVLQWLPVSSLGKKACLWSILGAPGVWWYDLKIDGVKKGYAPRRKIPL